jgi:hypothetical protein
MVPYFRNRTAVRKVPSFRPFVPLLRAMCRRRWVWNTGRKLLTGENRSTLGGKPCPNANLSTTNLTRTDLELKPDHRGYRPETNCLSHGRAKVVEHLVHQHNSKFRISQRTQYAFVRNTSRWMLCMETNAVYFENHKKMHVKTVWA